MCAEFRKLKPVKKIRFKSAELSTFFDNIDLECSSPVECYSLNIVQAIMLVWFRSKWRSDNNLETRILKVKSLVDPICCLNYCLIPFSYCLIWVRLKLRSTSDSETGKNWDWEKRKVRKKKFGRSGGQIPFRGCFGDMIFIKTNHKLF